SGRSEANRRSTRSIRSPDGSHANKFATLVVAPSVLLRLADCRRRLRDDGNRRDGADGILSVVASADRRVWLGPWPRRRGVLIRLPHLGTAEPNRRARHGCSRPSHRDIDGRAAAGTRSVVGPLYRTAVASLRDARRVGWRRRQLDDLYDTLTVLAELVSAPARACHQHCLLRGWCWSHHAAAVAPIDHRDRWLADVVLDHGTVDDFRGRSAQFARSQEARRRRAAGRWCISNGCGGADPRSQHR